MKLNELSKTEARQLDGWETAAVLGDGHVIKLNPQGGVAVIRQFGTAWVWRIKQIDSTESALRLITKEAA